jgi:TldD protein
MREIADLLLDAAASGGAAYADCRVVQRQVQSLAVKDAAFSQVSSYEDEGVGVRALVDGGWGFASVDRMDAASLEECAHLAVRIARASSRLRRRRVRLAPLEPATGRYVTPQQRDPFEVSLEEKMDLLIRADEAMAAVPGITTHQASLEFVREHRHFASTEGSRIEQLIVESGGGMDATAASANEVQTRSHPNSFGRHQVCAGFEAVEAMDLAGNAQRIAEEAVALLTAPPCPSGRMTLILDGSQAALQVHESCGHPTELDRVRGDEAAYAGTSFLTPDLAGRFRYGSDQVTISADATTLGGLGTYGWDDEGVPAQRTVLVDAGIFRAYMSSRETAAELGATSSGAMRAQSWSHIPLVRMTNVNLEPGDSSLEEMIATTEHGVYLQTNRSWSIDDRRLNFQFGTQNGWEIADGRVVRLVKNALYAGRTPEFWRSCDAVAGLGEWRMWGVVNCGKGQPSQLMHVGHGAAPCRFQGVLVTAAGG